MDPSKAALDPPRSIDNNQNNIAIDPPRCDLSDSLDRLSLVNATATPLPNSPSLLSPDAPSHPSHPSQLAPRRTPSSGSLRNERRKSIPALQKRSSTASLRSSSGNNGSSSPLADSPRRSSANFAGSATSGTSTASPATMSSRLKLGPSPDQELTAASIAAEHFQKETDLHQTVDLQSKAVVVIHDACYGHRFSRPNTSEKELEGIVERPERVRACLVGVAAAYVRLGQRYAGERFAPHPNLDIHCLPPPPFQIRKTSRSLPLRHEAVTSVHGTSWMAELQGMCENAESRLVSTGRELVRTRVRGDDGLVRTGPALAIGDLYLCGESQGAFEGALGAVCDAIDTVFSPGPTDRAFVCIRPPGHHCSASYPSGFCWVNNVHVGISYAASQHGLTHAAILDFDLHHGDGSQDIAWNHNEKVLDSSYMSSPYEKAPIGYYSLHDINSYPCEDREATAKILNASACIDGGHGQSIWNVHLERWETHTEFWNLYRTKYIALISKAREFLRNHANKLAETPNGPRPKAAIFISAGFDASEHESEGMQRHKRKVPTDFYAQFTADVVQMSQEEGLGVDGRVVSVLEGGYSDRALTSGVLSHLCGLTSVSKDTSSPFQPSPGPSAVDPTGVSSASQTSASGTSLTDTTELTSTLKPTLKLAPNLTEYTGDWWSSRHLDELQSLVAPPTKSREKPSSTFLQSTRSSSAKVVTPPRERKIVGSYTGLDHLPSNLPEVGWATASHELFANITPGNRQTTSHAPEYLGVVASRQRRQAARDGRSLNPDTVRQPPPAPVDNTRRLRARKAKSPTPYSPRPATPRQQAMRKNRRQTLEGNELPDDSRESSPSVDARRRKSTTAVAPGATDDIGASSNSKILSMDGSSSRKTSPDTPRKSSATSKPPPVPKVPTTFKPSKLSEKVARPEDNDVENLSTGLQKIKLVMPSPEEQAAREKKANEARKQNEKRAKTPKSPARKTTSTKTARGKTASRPENLPTSSPPALPTPPIGVSASDAMVKKENQPFNFGVSSDTPIASPAVMPTSNPIGAGSMELMSPIANHSSEWATSLVSPQNSEQPASFATNDSPRQITSNDLHMDASPQNNVFSPHTSEGHTKTGLPVFTSSSAIPFAASETPIERRPQDQPHTSHPQNNSGSNYPPM
ncbi:hypothetical protein N7507_005640 [Penicillium longicatenatum]|nr:hypothetical protein N7507_005640 [Penicillium longicatenatum]